MKWVSPVIPAVAFAFVPLFALGAEPAAPPQETIVFQHATVIDVASGAVRADRAVVVSGGRIAAVGPADRAAVPSGARVVDATGKYLIPGLWDMHVHFGIESFAPLFIANGVMGVRVMWGNPPGENPGQPSRFHTKLREQFSTGAALGPRMVIASGLVDGPNPIWPGSVVVRNAAEGREAVKAAKKAGADFVKVYELIPPDAYFAIAQEAKAQGIPFAGHIPKSITAAQASSAGQKSVEHLSGIRPACSTRENELMKRRAEALKNAKGLETIRAVAKFERDMVRETYSEQKAQALFALLRKNGTWQCPTLTVLRSVAWLDDAAFTSDERLKYVPSSMREFWNPKNDFRFKSTTPADFARMKREFREELKLTGAMKKAGVGFLAGTDELNPYCFAGFSLHDELALFVEAGFSPLEALQAATINPARYLEREKSQGTIEVGKDADLVLLDANPLLDIHNTAKIRAVVASGRFFDRAALDQILSAAEQTAAKKPPSLARETSPPRATGPADVYRGATVLTVSGGDIADADFVVRDGKFVAVGKRGEVAIPDGSAIHHLDGKIVVPGLVDTHSHIGIYPRPAVEAHSDGNELTGPVQPGIRALDAIWPDDPAIQMALAGGVTTANIMPGSGNAIGGQTLYVKLRPGPIANMMVQPGVPDGGLKMANGENPKKAYGTKKQAPNTRMRLAALQREQFVKALDYRRKWQSYREAQEKARATSAKPEDQAKAKVAVEPERDLALETLVEVLERKRTVHFHSHRADDIMTVVRLAEEFGFEVVLQHGTEAYKVAGELARRKIPVSLTIIDSPGGKPEVNDFIEQDGAILEKAGVKIAINTDDFITESRFLLRTASLAVRGGLSEAAALKALTLNPAEMLHLERRIGSIEPGKDADFVVLSGRPFSVYTQVLQTYIEGQKRYDRALGNQGNYAVGGFALADPSARPKPAPPSTPPARVGAPPGGGAAELRRAATRLAVRAGLLYTIKEPPIRNGVVLVEGGKIRQAGSALAAKLPEGTPVLSAAVVTPGLIDAHTVLGVSGRLNDLTDQDQDERSDPNQADARILDSFNPAEPLLEFGLHHGVTVIQACPGPANVIGGQAGIFRTHGGTAEAMTVRFPSAVVFHLGEAPKKTYPGKAPGTRMGTAALIRNALVAASNDRKKRESSKADSAPDRNLKHEALGLLLDRKIPALFSAHRADDLATALRLRDEFALEARLSMATEAYLMADTLAAAKVPVLVHPTMQRLGSPETFNSTLNNAGILADRGIPLAITTGFESYVPKTRVVRWEAAISMVNGLGYDRALRSITLDAARILKIDSEYGSLEPGKVADLVLYDGDPFEYTTHVTHVVLGGRVVYDRAAEAKQLPLRGSASGAGASEPECCQTF